jgi:hypothetical protein
MYRQSSTHQIGPKERERLVGAVRTTRTFWRRISCNFSAPRHYTTCTQHSSKHRSVYIDRPVLRY